MAISRDGITKSCPRCKQTRLLSEFGKRKRSKDGHYEYCKHCVKSNWKGWMQRKYAGLISQNGNSKKCSSCRETKPLTAFGRHKRSGDGLHPFCRPCVKILNFKTKERRRNCPELRELDALKIRSQKLKSTYGIEIGEYLQLEKEQSSLCAICRQPETNRLRGKLRSLSVDHDHQTGRIRGLLCTNCNNGLGRFREDPELLEKAALYLRKHKLIQDNNG